MKTTLAEPKQTTLFGQTFICLANEVHKRIAKRKERVRYILETYPQTRGDDNLLLWRYYNIFERDRVVFSFQQFKALLSMTTPESISRIRRKLQEQGDYLPREKTQIKRARLRAIMKKEMIK